MSIAIPTSTERSVASIKPYPGNPRHNESAIDAVAASIRRFGFRQPIVVDRNGVIVCGHTRFEAAKRLGMTAVPCVDAADLTDDAVRAYRLLDNKLQEKSSWDADALALELADLDYDFAEFGVSFDPAASFAPELAETPEKQFALPGEANADGADGNQRGKNADKNADGAGSSGVTNASDDVPRSYDLVVRCVDEAAQQALYERLAAEGYRVRLCNL